MNKLIVYTAVFKDGNIVSTSNKEIGHMWNELFYSPQKGITNKIIGMTSNVIPIVG